MSWRTEFGDKWDVPSLVDHLVSKKVIKDLSWKNDVSPSFGIHDDKTDRMVALWVDHPIKESREFQDDRFFVTDGESGTDPDYQEGFTELEDALRALFRRLAEYYDGEGDWEDPDEHLRQFVESYY